ncbi:hypothetical protein E3T55_18855 [Cryobacterium frigoriphilum]|uniref:GntR family transcriptional regulator n=1 Tax=Cryobacterium frigoriphilum TaxID=1259150 RepID=A0A4R8ZTZ1_9MICO|nr:hypothetical protein [Cryobacterium frigoriphilum]TFD45392.1 hypothetical protein E3T55_18855 [Cryobacterium frigoriphilum]
MIDLAREGLVEPIRNKGYFVVQLRDDDLTALRALIEVPTGGMVEILESHGLPASAAEVGEPRLIE